MICKKSRVGSLHSFCCCILVDFDGAVVRSGANKDVAFVGSSTHLPAIDGGAF